MAEDDERLISRRSSLTHVAAGIIGWLLGSFLDPLRRSVNRLILNTPLGRRAKVSFGYSVGISQPTSENRDDSGFTLHITNNGSETAENLAAHIAFKERIVDYEVVRHENTPPIPSTEIEITNNGTARIRAEYVRRDIVEHFNPIIINLFTEEGTESNHAFRLDSDEDIFAAYEYSWTFLGTRYYESTKNHIVEVE